MMTSESFILDLLFGLLIGVLVGVIGQRRLVASVLCHVVPCDQTLANGGSPWLETLVRGETGLIIVFQGASGSEVVSFTNLTFSEFI